ncbi:unnamed protein product, partial [Choristocarpus tenellus]
LANLRVLLNKEGKCRGLALVRFMEKEYATKALESIPGIKMGNPEKTLSVRKSDNSNTLFIGNLNKIWTKAMVQKAFEDAVAGVVNFELTMDAMNKDQNRGFGFATFETVEACKAAHAKWHKDKLKIMENFVLMDWAETRGNKEDDDRGIYILNVDPDVDDLIFRAHFAKYGTIEKVVYGRLIPHARRNDFAIINFSNRDAAKNAIAEMNGTMFQGRSMEITMAKAKRKRDFSQAGYGGGRGSYEGRGGGYGGRGGGRGYNHRYENGGGGRGGGGG